MAKIGINIATGTLQQEEIVAGIDLGNTNNLVAIIHPGEKKPVALKEHDGLSLVPAIVHIARGGVVTVGEPARPYLKDDPANTIFSVKRLLGKSLKDLGDHAAPGYKIIDNAAQSTIWVKAALTLYSPVDLLAIILKELKQRAEHIIKMRILKAVITVPAWFSDAQRQAMREAAGFAGLEILDFITDPQAASLAYGPGWAEGKTIAVYYLGGSTFNISIVKIIHGIAELLSTSAEAQFGGDNFDSAIAKRWMSQHGMTDEHIASNRSLFHTFRSQATLAKEHLTYHPFYTGTAGDIAVSLTRHELDELLEPLIESTIMACSQALLDGGVAIGTIDAVIMAGGSTRIPLVKQAVASFFGKPVMDYLEPDEVLALGAALHADIVAGKKEDMDINICE